MSDTKKYYWLKLQRDFFKRHDIQIIEHMPNGEKYLIFYLKLLCESVDHDGRLRFSEEIPYEVEMLATITHMDIDTVKSAVKLFTNLKMMDLMDDGTFYMNQIEKMTGSVSSDALRMKLAREKNIKSLPDNDKPNNVQKCSKIVHQSIEIRDKSIELRDNNTPDKPESKKLIGKEYSQDFMTFWEAYPKREGKKVAYKNFQTLIKAGKKIDWILSMLTVYKERIRVQNTAYVYIRNPSTFLNNIDDYADGFIPPVARVYSKLSRDLSNGYTLPTGMDELPGEMQ